MIRGPWKSQSQCKIEAKMDSERETLLFWNRKGELDLSGGFIEIALFWQLPHVNSAIAHANMTVIGRTFGELVQPILPKATQSKFLGPKPTYRNPKPYLTI